MTRSIAVGLCVVSLAACSTTAKSHDEPADAKKTSASSDDGIKETLKEALLRANAETGVDCTVKAGVVTLSGRVDSPDIKKKAGQIASDVPNVKAVINDLRVKTPEG